MEMPILSDYTILRIIRKHIKKYPAHEGFHLRGVVAKAQQKEDLRWFVEELDAIMNEARLGSRLSEIETFLQSLKDKLSNEFPETR